MEKNTERNVTPSRPMFTKGTTVTEPSLVVDEHGVAWWVEPNSRQIYPVAVDK